MDKEASIDPVYLQHYQKDFVQEDYNVESFTKNNHKSFDPSKDNHKSFNTEKTKSFLGTIVDGKDNRSSSISISDLPPGTKSLLILHSYTSSLEDELDLVEGTRVFLVKQFDDGWALGVDPRSGNQGAFPLVCVDTRTSADKRESSMGWFK